MFKFLKEKLKGAVSQLSEKIDKEGKEEVKEEKGSSAEELIEDVPKEEKKGFFEKIKEKFVGKEEVSEEQVEEYISKPEEEGFKEVPIEKLEKETEEEKKEKEETEKREEKREIAEEKVREKKEIPSIQELAERKPKAREEAAEEKKGVFAAIKEKIVTKKIDESKFDELFWELEVILLENNVAVEVIEKIKTDLKMDLVDKPIKRGQISSTILNSLKDAVYDLFDVEKVDVISRIKEKKPFVICFVGINGSGKTTTIAKFAKMLEKNGLSCVLAAADTFRAAAIDQLQKHADNLKVKLIKHDYGSDAAAVAFDAVKHAQAKGIDCVLIDTAGRMHSNVNLMDEMEKIVRVAKPDMKIFVGESITGNDCTEQAKKFNEAIGIDGIVLSKADVDEKGGAAISVSYVTGRPIFYIGTGQEYNDLEEFDSGKLIEQIGL